MDKDLFLIAGMLRKRADGPIGKLVSGLSRSGTELVKLLTSSGLNAAKIGIPLTTLGMAYLLSRSQSPKAVADNAHNYAINEALEQSIAQSKTDLAQLLAQKAISRTNKFHDQYL